MIFHDTNVGAMSNDAAVDEGGGEEAAFDAGFRMKTNPSGSVTQAVVNPHSTHSGDALEVRARRNSGAVDALRALIEGTREKECLRETYTLNVSSENKVSSSTKS